MGDLGPSAEKWIDLLAEAGQKLWQILPLTIPDHTGSPYSSYSAFAANTRFISPEKLCRDNACSKELLQTLEQRISDPVLRKQELLKAIIENQAWMEESACDFREFKAQNHSWLEDYALFTSLMKHFQSLWTEWPQPYRDRSRQALLDWQEEHGDELDYYKLEQFIFHRQWNELRHYATRKNIRIIGDIPIFVAYNSVDVWAHRTLFKLDDRGLPTVVAGVPPDIFSETGQLWGNPHYNWDVLRERDYSWWFDRIGHLLNQVDFVRLDHFRGFAGAWEVPFGEKTAEHGSWVSGGGQGFFDALSLRFGNPPIIAEDLGIITEDVSMLMARYGFPGMKILQFAFDSGPDNGFLPANYGNGHCIVYTGTHDNNTLAGWYEHAADIEKNNLAAFLDIREAPVVWPLIEAASASSAVWAVIPLQDILELGEEARMNFPSTTEGNWVWRRESFEGLDTPLQRLRQLTARYGRI